MASPLPAIIDEMLPAMQRGDLDGFHRLNRKLVNEARGRSASDLTEAIERIAPILARRPEGIFARLALTAGAFVEWGASPLALAENAPACTVMTMMLRMAFSEVWPRVGGGRTEPDMDNPPEMNDLIALFRAARHELGVDERVTTMTAVSWFDAPHWVNLMITLLARREFRDVAGLRAEIAEDAQKLTDVVPRAHWLPGLALVLDDEPLIAIDHATGRGYRLTMSGIGDNYQLHTLLADRVTGDTAQGLLAGERPAPSWVAAATTAPPQMPVDDLIHRRFRLFDATGAYVLPEGRPADIAVVDGVRLVVLHQPRGNYMWMSGRTYEAMARPSRSTGSWSQMSRTPGTSERLRLARRTSSAASRIPCASRRGSRHESSSNPNVRTSWTRRPDPAQTSPPVAFVPASRPARWQAGG
jgi:hypothetical protein